jgi:hypothetical protein
VAVVSREIELVHVFEHLDSLERLLGKGRFVLKRVEANALQQVSQIQVVVFGDTLEDLEQTLFQANPSLDASLAERNEVWGRRRLVGWIVPLLRIANTKPQPPDLVSRLRAFA